MLDIEPHPIGLERKRFNECIDKLLETGELNPEIIGYMNERQQGVINEVKKAFARIKRKYERQITEGKGGLN